ncbi:hypothetical protein AL492_00275 [Elizabethkingia anophelis]|uniref:Cytochrome C n=1 Tax=Elizabethkingia miricola TaxID=172045 RepID=A0ABD5B7N7_ELIMR|nr:MULTISPECIES: hypothetical protein [Weeksellaceae]AVF49533.1 hypothetical protein AL491_16265 [Elizabethkingia anophelis]AVF50155.1 hypothetical protein AL492_00275 [Elizabethkingia anophelis]MDQ8749930.1 hypothetical protein [Elizabethkingia miricola]MDV4035685.1 hypothetical protein [Elizabethkingia anophelis]
MKYLFIAPIILTLSACNQTDSNQQTLQNQVDSLQAKLNNSYKPGFGEFMSSVQVHHAKLWFAGMNQNWKLADFEVGEIQESINGIRKFCTDRPEVQSLPMIDPALDNIKKAIQQQNTTAFKDDYVNLTNTCNSCHQATKHKFNVITVPTSPPFNNQDFKPHNEK